MVGSGCDLRCSSFSRGRIDHKLDLRHAVCQEAALLRVFADHLLVGSDIDAVDFVPSYITVEPLNLWSQILEHVAGFLRNRCHLLRCYIPHSGDIAFDDVFRHAFLLRSRPLREPSCRKKILGCKPGNCHLQKLLCPDLRAGTAIPLCVLAGVSRSRPPKAASFHFCTCSCSRYIEGG